MDKNNWIVLNYKKNCHGIQSLNNRIALYQNNIII